MTWRRRALRTALAAGILASVAGTPPALARGGVYGGMTSDDEAIVLRTDAKGKKLKSAVLGWSARCSDGTSLDLGGDMTADELNLARNRRGRFRGEMRSTLTGGDGTVTVTLDIAGKVRAKRASGTLSVRVSGNLAQQTLDCSTPAMTWKAKRAPGRVFGGSTTQDWPVVVTLDKARRNVDRIAFGWNGDCVPDGYYATADYLDDFPIKDGRFGDTFSSTFNTGDGGRQMFDYDLSGNVGRTAARGTFDVKVTQTDGAGAQTYSCDTGSVSWTARTG